MQVTKTSFKKPTNPQSTALAQCSMTFDNCFVVTGMKICNGKSGPFLSMPSFKDKQTGEYVDTCFPISKEYRTILMNAGLQGYNKWLQDGCPEAPPKAGTQPQQQAFPGANTPPGFQPQQAAPDYGIQWGQPQTSHNGAQYVQGVPTQAFNAAFSANRNAMEMAGWVLQGNIVYKALTPPPAQTELPY